MSYNCQSSQPIAWSPSNNRNNHWSSNNYRRPRLNSYKQSTQPIANTWASCSTENASWKSQNSTHRGRATSTESNSSISSIRTSSSDSSKSSDSSSSSSSSVSSISALSIKSVASICSKSSDAIFWINENNVSLGSFVFLRDHMENRNLPCVTPGHNHTVTLTDREVCNQRKTALGHPAIIIDITDERENPNERDFTAVVCLMSTKRKPLRDQPMSTTRVSMLPKDFTTANSLHSSHPIDNKFDSKDMLYVEKVGSLDKNSWLQTQSKCTYKVPFWNLRLFGCASFENRLSQESYKNLMTNQLQMPLATWVPTSQLEQENEKRKLAEESNLKTLAEMKEETFEFFKSITTTKTNASKWAFSDITLMDAFKNKILSSPLLYIPGKEA